MRAQPQNTARIGYRDPLVKTLGDDIAALISGDAVSTEEIEERLRELARVNSPKTAAYWCGRGEGLGVPDNAYKTAPPYLFPEHEPVRTFRTSMTTGTAAGSVPYSARGLELMDLSILANARRHVTRGLDRPSVIRLVPDERHAPAMVMAHGMELIARTLGHAPLSASVLLTSGGFDIGLLRQLLGGALAEQRPVVLLGATSAFVNLCQVMKDEQLRWTLPSGSRLVDAGGPKRQSRPVAVDELRAMAESIFGIGPGGHTNLFGMTELSSQLYDSADMGVGPLGERPKRAERFVRPQVRDPFDLTLLERGAGILEVVDLCVLDRPCALLTGDWAIAGPHGAAITGRVERGCPRGCSVSLDEITRRSADD